MSATAQRLQHWLRLLMACLALLAVAPTSQGLPQPEVTVAAAVLPRGQAPRARRARLSATRPQDQSPRRGRALAPPHLGRPRQAHPHLGRPRQAHPPGPPLLFLSHRALLR